MSFISKHVKPVRYISSHRMTHLAYLLQVRLNERNVVELINKLNQLGFLGDGLLHTVNGREYVTPEHLRKELLEAVEQAGGRMSLVASLFYAVALKHDAAHCASPRCTTWEIHRLSLLTIPSHVPSATYTLVDLGDACIAGGSANCTGHGHGAL